MTTGVADTAKGGEDPGAGGSFGAVRSVNDSNVDHSVTIQKDLKQDILKGVHRYQQGMYNKA